MSQAVEISSLRDEDDNLSALFLKQVSALLAKSDAQGLKAKLALAHEADMGDLIESLEQNERLKLIALMGDEFDFTALTEIDEKLRVEILESLPLQQVAEGISDLDSDDALTLLEDLEEDDKAKVLEFLPLPERITLERSLTYPEGSVARRMKTEVIAVPPFWNVGQTIDFLRENTDLPDDFNEVFVVDPTYHLVGILQLHKILRHQRPALVSHIMEEARHVVQADDEQAEAARLFERYNLISTPVVDDAKRLVGILTIDDIVDVLNEEADSDIKALGGVQADEELTDRVKTVLPSRFTWLFVNLLTALLSSFVISQFAETIKSMVALAVLMPIVASMGGNAGTQTMTVAVRALATQELTHANAWRIIRRELIVGLLNGLAFALIMGVVVSLWYPDVHIFPVIGLAIVITLVAAAFGGIIIPLTLEKMGVDPAISSGPLVTTITDVVGFFTFLGLASLWLIK